MMLRLVAILLICAVALPLRAEEHPRTDVPVMIGGEEGWDACYGSGTVMHLDPRGDGFLSVRSGPGGKPYSEIARVYNGQHVWICDEKGPWLAVVYQPGHLGDDCGVTTEVRKRIPYTGPCRYGWVHSRYVGDMAN